MSVQSFWTSAEKGICRWCRRVWKILVRTINKYVETDGELRAASFGYYAFFAIFPLILLFVTLGTMIWGDKHLAATQVLGVINVYIPVGPNEQNVIVQTVSGVINSRSQAGIVAVLALAWSSLRFFQALVHGVNRAWGMQEYSWWHLPLANLAMVAILGSTLLLGIVAPVIMRGIQAYWLAHKVVGFELLLTSFNIARLFLPWLILFYGLIMFYKYAPRQKVHLKDVWVAALTVTIGVQLLNKAFIFYAANFAKFNVLYGTLSSVVAVLMWIYLAGSLIILGGCLCAAQSEVLLEEQKEGTPEI